MGQPQTTYHVARTPENMICFPAILTFLQLEILRQGFDYAGYLVYYGYHLASMKERSWFAVLTTKNAVIGASG